MNIIFLRRGGNARRVNLAHPLTLSVIALLGLTLLGGAFALGMQFGLGAGQRGVTSETLHFRDLLGEQKHQIADLRQQLQLRVDAFAMRLGEMNAHVIRLDALGRRLTEMADIDSHEFNFDDAPPSGGPETEGEGVSPQIPDLTQKLAQLEQRMNLGDTQLTALENVILARELNEDIHPEGRPVTRGFISSYFGERADPFDGREAFHKGVDFAGSLGDKVQAVAEGVVTWAGERSGFGKLVEINHGDGYITRYAHNSRTLVAVGQMVKRGEAVALMGSTGRSTGPHVHFEVLRNGRQVDPLSYIRR
jgi:murein DD-endopeptidase MepM/ murein hydrolase activator NlpD